MPKKVAINFPQMGHVSLFLFFTLHVLTIIINFNSRNVLGSFPLKKRAEGSSLKGYSTAIIKGAPHALSIYLNKELFWTRQSDCQLSY